MIIAIRIFGALAATAAAINAALLAAPGDVVPQAWLVGAAIVSAGASAFVAFLAKGEELPAV